MSGTVHALSPAPREPAAPGVFAWPIPPFFTVDGAPPRASAACTAELDDGSTLAGELTEFDPDHGTVRLLARGQTRQIALDRLRVLRLDAPLTLLRARSLVADIGGAEPQAAERRSFAVRFVDGKTLSGTTCGFVRTRAGLFLYPPAGERAGSQAWFIPAQQVEDVRIGQPLGEALQRTQHVSGEVITAALDKQQQLRTEKLGEQMLRHGIVRQDELRNALSLQRRRPTMRLGELLRQLGLVTTEQLAEALRLQEVNRRRRLGDILVEMGAVTPRVVQMALSEKLGIPYVDVSAIPVEPTALQKVDARFAHEYQVLPLMVSDDSLVVAVRDPLDMPFEQDLRFHAGANVVPVVASPDELQKRIAAEYARIAQAGHVADRGVESPAQPVGRSRNLADIDVAELAGALARGMPEPASEDAGEADTHITDNAMVRLVNKIIVDAHAQGASDIHIESNPGRTATRVRFRKDGELEDYLHLQPAFRNALVSRIKIMAGLDIAEHRRGQDGKIAFGRFGPLGIELRVAIVPTSSGLEDVVLRVLGGVEPLPLEKLGLSPRDARELKRMLARSYGLILVCGPTGSGKTTTLHSALHHINRPDIKIWTAEDPIEITQPGLRQVQINSEIGWTFASAMRSFLRADPDVIMVGEMRDAETATIGIGASLTGHLVLSTLHTNSAAECVARLLDLGMDPFNFADALIGILSQRLVRKLCEHCKRAREASEAETAQLLDEYCEHTRLDPRAVLDDWRQRFAVDGKLLVHEAVGCKDCRQGYKGRIGVYELLSGTAQVKDLVRARGTVPQIVEAACAGGMRLLRQDAIEKVLLGIVDRASARAAAA